MIKELENQIQRPCSLLLLIKPANNYLCLVEEDMTSPQTEVPSPGKHLQFDPLVPSQTNGNSIQGEGHKSQLRIPVPAAKFRRLVEQNDCHSFITTDPKYLVGMFDEKRRTVAQEFLASTGSPSYWVCNIKQA
jgi:hypothetical protein